MSYDNGRGGWTGEMPSRSRYGPLEVVVGERGVEAAIRLFKRLVLRDGILQAFKRRSHYEKPGDRRRRKVREADRRRRKQARRALLRDTGI
ncbi:MAG TPA: 30S ribosomal protein S21 [Candidatus Methylomirabilis sp.]|nr:30S ribosomal protein S21 [Candidatus Methylomirabilis sp.]